MSKNYEMKTPPKCEVNDVIQLRLDSIILKSGQTNMHDEERSLAGHLWSIVIRILI